MTHRLIVVYKENYKYFIPEERINLMVNYRYDFETLEHGASTIFENCVVEKPMPITYTMPSFLMDILASSLSEIKNEKYSISRSSFIDDYLDLIPEPNNDSKNNSCKYISASMPIGSIEIVNKKMEFENELFDHYLLSRLGDFKISPLCNINNEILNLLTERYVSFYLEEHDGVVKPFYNIHLKNESFVSDFSIKTGSLDFKNDDLFINSLIKMLNNYKITGFTFDEVKQAPLEYLQMIELLKY